MELKVEVLHERGCGFRKVGGLYLCGGPGISVTCGRLPYPIKVCPVCGEHIRPTRGYQWVDGPKYFEVTCENNCDCHRHGCVVCNSDELGKCLFMWVGEEHYTPGSFETEARDMGISKRIPGKKLPDGVELGKTWCLLAHRKAYPDLKEVEQKNGEKKTIVTMKPGIFYAFLIQRAELLITEKQAQDEQYVKQLLDEGITPVVVKTRAHEQNKTLDTS